MDRTSASIGAIAGALAKAQCELVNPAKSQTATLRLEAGERRFRYAPLSSGLEIVRKSLGRHEIAVVQTTRIDTEAGLIRLTTVLAHVSGEWVSSEWPVCAVAEVAAPHRLGAALTYARRYALFTLVGLAGEDDLDAPDLNLGTEPPLADPPRSTADVSLVVTGQTRPPTRRAPAYQIRSELTPEASALERERLEAELGALIALNDLLRWARNILPLKNTLIAEDARHIEQAFEAKMASLGQMSEAEPASPALALGSAARPAPVLDDPPPTGTPGRGEDSGRTGEGVGHDLPHMALAKTRRRRDKAHLAFVAAQPCIVCGRTPSDAHHLRCAEPRALGRKVSDEFTVPLCRAHHRALHSRGNEREWWSEVRIEPLPIAERLWRDTRPRSG